MSKILWRNLLLLAAVVIVLAAVVLVPGGMAHAQTTTSAPTTQVTTNPYSCSFTSVGTCIPFLLFYLLWAFVSIFVSLGVWLVTTFLTLNGNVFNSPAVQAGFGLSLSLANLGLVLGIIVIAIATILRNQTYGLKQILWKLIFVAIIVNFGLVITRPIVAFSDSMTSYFENAIGGNTGNFATTVASAFNQQNFLPPPPSASTQAAAQAAWQSQCNSSLSTALSTTSGPGSPASNPTLAAQCAQLSALSNGKTVNDNFVGDMISLLFGCVFSFVVVLALFALAALLIVRYVWLAMLLILLPLAWVTWAFPKFSSHFSKWWDNFVKWTFFPVLAMFFMYLAFLAAGQNSQQGLQYLNAAAPAMSGSTLAQNPAATFLETASTGGTPTTPSVLQTALDATVLCALLIGGLFAAASLTGKAGQMAVSTGKSISNSVADYAGRKTKAGARNVSRNVGDRIRASGKKYNPLTRETTTGLQRLGSRLQNVPGLRGVGVSMSNASAPAAIKKGREKDVQDYVDNNLKSLTNDGIIARATSKTAFINPTQSAAIAQELARRNLTTHPKITATPGLMDKYVAAADRVGNLEKVTNNRPDLMPQRKDKFGRVMETKEEAIARAVKAARGDVVQANAESFNLKSATAGTNGTGMSADQVKSAILALGLSQVSTLGSDLTGDNEDRKNNITDAIKGLVAPFVSATKNAAGKYELNSAALLASGIASLDQLKNLDKMVKHMESNNNWGSAIGN